MKLEMIIEFVKKQLAGEVTGHDFYHSQRVANLASQMYLEDNPQAQSSSRIVALIRAGGYLHDTIDEKICPQPQMVLKKLPKLLAIENFTDLEIKDILFTITHLSFSKNVEEKFKLPLSGKYVQDADRLESLGAIGIARAFTYGGNCQQAIYDPEIKVQSLRSHDQYRKHPTTTINHFYEKLLKLPALMNTAPGKKEAQRRAWYLKEFLKEFMQEWNV